MRFKRGDHPKSTADLRSVPDKRCSSRESPHGGVLTKTLPKVAAEMALTVLAYNLTRVMNIVGSKLLMAAIVA